MSWSASCVHGLVLDRFTTQNKMQMHLAIFLQQYQMFERLCLQICVVLTPKIP
jgi:hypothetical protein